MSESAHRPERDSRGRFLKGETGNPGGRPSGRNLVQVMGELTGGENVHAIAAVWKEKLLEGHPVFWRYFLEQFYPVKHQVELTDSRVEVPDIPSDEDRLSAVELGYREVLQVEGPETLQ